VAEHFNRISALSGLILEYSDDGSFGVVAEGLIDLVTNCKFGSHDESSDPQGLRRVRPKYGLFAIRKTGQIDPHTVVALDTART
jgi:hypothetical protein